MPQTSSCIFCEIVAGERLASVVYEDEQTMAFVDVRQFNPGHVLVIPKLHIPDVREADEIIGAAIMRTVSHVTRAVAAAFPHEGISLWHSIGPAAFQEVPHLHIHIHPRRTDDGFLRVYPGDPPTADRKTRDQYAAKIRHCL